MPPASCLFELAVNALCDGNLLRDYRQCSDALAVKAWKHNETSNWDGRMPKVEADDGLLYMHISLALLK